MNTETGTKADSYFRLPKQTAKCTVYLVDKDI